MHAPITPPDRARVPALAAVGALAAFAACSQPASSPAPAEAPARSPSESPSAGEAPQTEPPAPAQPAPGETIALFNGDDLGGWHADVPSADGDPAAPPSFAVRDGQLISLGSPAGHLISDDEYGDYRLLVEYRWTGEPGNCGVLVHASTPRHLYAMFPKSIEVQMHAGNAGDFWCIGEDIAVENMEERRGPRARWGVDADALRRIRNLTDDSENPPGEWNRLEIECRGDEIKVWVNGDLVNHGTDCTATRGHVALQAEGSEVAFRRIELTKLEDAEEQASAAPADASLKNIMNTHPEREPAVSEATFAAG